MTVPQKLVLNDILRLQQQQYIPEIFQTPDGPENAGLGAVQHHGSRAGCPQRATESAGPLNIYCVWPKSGVVPQSERFWLFLKEERQGKKVSGA